LPPAFRRCGRGSRRIPPTEASEPGAAVAHCRLELHADRRRGSSRSIADTAAKRRHSRISSAWRPGYSERISASVRPPANDRNTVATGIRRWRTHGTPRICAKSTAMRSKFFTGPP
jgi:hypothetical protein